MVANAKVIIINRIRYSYVHRHTHIYVICITYSMAVSAILKIKHEACS